MDPSARETGRPPKTHRRPRKRRRRVNTTQQIGGALSVAGIPATGRKIRYISHEFYGVAGGMIAEEWICSDMASLFHQPS